MLLNDHSSKLIANAGAPDLNIPNSLIYMGLLQFSLRNKLIIPPYKTLIFQRCKFRAEIAVTKHV